MRALGPKYRVSFGSGDGEPQERVAGRDFRLDHRCLRRHLYRSGILAHGESPHAVVELLRRYRQEWLAVAAEGQERGWSWVKLLTPTTFTNQKGRSHASA